MGPSVGVKRGAVGSHICKKQGALSAKSAGTTGFFHVIDPADIETTIAELTMSPEHAQLLCTPLY